MRKRVSNTKLHLPMTRKSDGGYLRQRSPGNLDIPENLYENREEWMKAHADQMKQAKDYKDLMAINHWGVERLPELERSKSQQMFPFSKANRKYNNTQNT